MSEQLREIATKINQQFAGGKFIRAELVPSIPPTYLFTFEDQQEQVGQMTIQAAATIMPDPGKVVIIPAIIFAWHPYHK